MIELLTLGIVGRNQREPLEQLLRQFQDLDLVFELIYVDLGSADDSLRRAALYCDRVYSLPSDGSDADWNFARNLICQHAEFDWVLCLQAGELLSAEALRFLESGIYAKNPQVDAWLWATQSPSGTLHVPPSPPGIFMHWEFLGQPEWQSPLLRRQAVLASGNWNPNLGEGGGYELLWRMTRLGSKTEILPWIGTEQLENPPLAQGWARYRRTSCLFWDWVRSLDVEGFVRCHPWIILQSLGLFLLLRTEYEALISWGILQILHLWFQKPLGYLRFWFELPSLLWGNWNWSRFRRRTWFRRDREELFELQSRHWAKAPVKTRL
jgi:hypothetical protein